MSHPSESPRVDPGQFFYLDHRQKGGGWAVARVVPGSDIRILWSQDFPPGDEDESIEWLLYLLDGTLMCSEWEWFELTDELIAESQGQGGRELVELVKAAESFFSHSEGEKHPSSHEAGRTGSPLGRADGGEPPAPAAD